MLGEISYQNSITYTVGLHQICCCWPIVCQKFALPSLIFQNTYGVLKLISLGGFFNHKLLKWFDGEHFWQSDIAGVPPQQIINFTCPERILHGNQKYIGINSLKLLRGCNIKPDSAYGMAMESISKLFCLCKSFQFYIQNNNLQNRSSNGLMERTFGKQI